VFNNDVSLETVHMEFDVLYKAIEKMMVEHYMEREGRIMATIEAEHEGEEDASTRADDQWRFFEREQYLRSIDRLWKAHLVEMSHLRTGIHLEAYAQKDPKIAYKKEGYSMFQDLLVRISFEVVRRLFRVEVQSEAEIEKLKERKQRETVEGRGAAQGEGDPGSAPVKQQTVRKDQPKVGRNDACPCGSGKKYKKCCLLKNEAGASA